MNTQKNLFLGLRLVMGFMFLWAFIDKVFGLGFATTPEKSWLHGGSPTMGFLSHSTGPFSSIFMSLAGLTIIDWLFMLGLLFIGLTLMINRYVFWGSLAGVIMVLLMWLAVLPPANNPIIDEHVVYAFVLGLLAIKSKRGELGMKN